MFRALCAHHQEGKLYYTVSGIVIPVEKTLESSLNLCTEQPPTGVTIPDTV